MQEISRSKERMRRCLHLAAMVPLVAVASVASAASSGNYAATVDTTQCAINRYTGALEDTHGGTLLETTIKTPNSSQTGLLISPSLVTGLYTNTLITETNPESTQGAAVVVKVTLDGEPVLPATPENPGVIYDERFQQISTNLFSHIEQCSDDNSETGDEECNMGMLLSTMSAHSFDFVAANVGGGEHDLKVEWEFQCYGSNGESKPCTTAFMPNTAGACVGPATVAVQQTQFFKQSGGLTIK